MYNWETFQTAYQAAAPELRNLIDSEVIPACVGNIIAAKQLDASHYKKLLRIYALLSLRAITESTAEQELMKIGIPAGREILNELNTCTGKSSPEKGQSEQKPETLAEQAKAAATLPIPPKQPSQGVPSIRTMAGDMAKTQATGEKVYSSTQEAILKEGWSTPKQDTPK